MSEWTSRLRQASFRGVPFAVLGDDTIVGRRQAVHEFPGVDTPYAEDMGRATRRRTIRGFLIENSAVYGGGDVIGQRDRILAAAEAYGPGALVHPTEGRLSVSIQQLAISEKQDQGRYFELTFEFVEAGAPAFSLGILSTINTVLSVANAALDVFGSTFASSVSGLTGSAVNGDAVATAAAFSDQVASLGADAGSAFSLSSTSVGSAANSRVLLTSAGSDLQISASRINTAIPDYAAVSASTAALIGGLASVSPDPGDQMRLVSQLSGGGL